MRNLLLLCGVFGTFGYADVKLYSSRAEWLAAVASPTTIDFGTAAPVPNGTYHTYPTPPGVTLSGVNFSSTKNPGGNVYIDSQNYCCATYQRGHDQLVSTYDGAGIVVTLPSGIAAAGFDMFSVVSGNYGGTDRDSINVTVGGVTHVIQTAAAPATVFVGFISSAPIGSFTVVPQQLNGATQVDLINFAFSLGPPPSVTILPSPNPKAGALAAASLATVTATGFSFGSASADVSVVDASGAGYDLLPLTSSASQIVVVLPATLASGDAVFTVTPKNGNPVVANANVAPIAPGILSADGSGGGVAAAIVTTTHPDGSVTVAPAYACLTAGNCIPLTIALGDPSQQQVVVTLFGTGIRGMSSLAGVTVSLSGNLAPVLSGGAQGDYAWLDQVSFQLPAGVAGAGLVSVTLTVDNAVANTVTLSVN